MTAISITKARSNLYQLMEEVNNNCEPITITNSRGVNGVLISEKDWNAIQETLYLNSVPGMVKSILNAENEEGGQTVYKKGEEW